MESIVVIKDIFRKYPNRSDSERECERERERERERASERG